LKKTLLIFIISLVSCKPVVRPSTIVPASGTSPGSIATETAISQPMTTSTAAIEPTIPASVVELDGAEVPPGFSLIRFADVPRPTAFTFNAQGRMLVTSQDEHVYMLADESKDGRADKTSIFASGYVFPLGIAVDFPTGDVYISHEGVISALHDINGDNQADGERILAGDLPFGKHQNDNLEFGPDGWLYVGVGSTCDACEDSNPLAASILRFNVETGEREIFAAGLRNPFDLAFQPGTGELFATDNGRDDLGMDVPFEELNHIIQGGDYGYPRCWNEQDQPGCENTIPAAAFFEAHSSADGVDFYEGQRFPAEYRGNAFVTIFGSWLKSGVQTGIQRIVLTPAGNRYSGESSWFIRFPIGVMPLPIAYGPDDALYVGDYINGVIYRISYGIP
jgi:glucose/arabinose dehydrogenase